MAFSLYATLKDVPVGFERHPINQMEVRVLNDSITQVQHIWDPTKPLGLEAVALREAFLGVGTLEQAVTFLQICGPFIDHQVGKEVQTITWKDFQDWQGFARRILLTTKWSDIAPFPDRVPKHIAQETQYGLRYQWFTDARLEPRRNLPGIWFMCRTALETIAATISADKTLRRATFKECPFPSCNKIFEAATIGGHEKLYCTPDHSRRAAKARALARDPLEA
jgi:hypothetical protein